MSSRLLALALVAFAATACSSSNSDPNDDGGDAKPPVRIAFTADTFAVDQDGNLTVRAYGYDEDDQQVDTVNVTYSGTNANATVSASGAVTGLQPGTADLTATSATLGTDEAVLEVFGHPVGINDTAHTVTDRPFGIAVSRTGLIYVLRLDAGTISVLDATRQVIDSITVGFAPTGVTFSRDGQRAYVTNQGSQSLGVIDVATGTQVNQITLGANPYVTEVSPDGSKVLVSTNLGKVYVVSNSASVTDSFTVGDPANGIAFHPSSNLVYISRFTSGLVSEVNLGNGNGVRTFGPSGSPQGIAVNRAGSELYVANEAGWLEIYDLTTGTSAKKVTLDGGGFGLAVSPDGKFVYVTIPAEGKVQVVSVATRTVVNTITVAGHPRRIAISRHGDMAVVANENNYVNFVR